MIRRCRYEGREIPFYQMDPVTEGIRIECVYARKDNFLGRKFYPFEAFFLVEPVARDLLRVRDWLKPKGFGLYLFDGYRPWSVTREFWELSNPEIQKFLANPERGSVHNRGCAVDLSLFDLNTGSPVQMPSGFDEMNEKAFRDYPGGSIEERRCRDLLREAMESHRFKGISNEWWHFNHQDLGNWPVMDFSFEEIVRAQQIPPQPREW